MLRKAKDNSVLIDFDLTSDSPELINLAADLLIKLGVTRKHLPRKQQILITLIVNLVLNFARGFCTAIPRGENFYSRIPPRYKPENMSHDIIVDLIDRMKLQSKYVVEYIKAPKNEFTEASQYYPSDLLVSLTDEILKGTVTFIEEECILLRKKVPGKLKVTETSNQESELTAEESLISGLEDEGELTKKLKKILVDYPDTEYTNSIREDLKEYNQLRIQNSLSLKDLPASKLFHQKYNKNIQFFASVNISRLKPKLNGNYDVPLAPDRLVRIFTEDFEHGGRFYRGFETQLKKELRQYIAINGSPTIEFDYSAYHIRMLYHLDNKRCPVDPYTVYEELDPDEGRDYYKTMVAACLNNNGEKAVLRTMRQYIIKKGLTGEFSDLTDKTLKKGLDLLISHNKKVANHFFQSNGLIYHRIDSDIANDLLMYFTRLKKTILVLCVHDSFIIAKEHSEVLKWAMNKFYRAKVQKHPQIK